MAVFTTERTARKAHTCSTCLRQIKPGQRHQVHVATPNDIDLGNTRWRRLRSHLTYGDCYPEYLGR
jgi:hypothetical protein